MRKDECKEGMNEKDERMNKMKKGWINELMNERGGRISEWMNKWMKEWMALSVS